MQRHRFFFGFIAALLVVSSTSYALDRGRKVTVTNTEHAAQLMQAVENAVWVADGPVSDKVVYVVYGTDCGWSHRLFNDTRGKLGDVQFRWIAVAGPQAPEVSFNRLIDNVGAAFENRAPRITDQAAGKRAVAYNYGVMSSINFIMRNYSRDATFAFPTLIYQSADGVKLHAGNPDNLTALLADVASTSVRAESTAVSLTTAGWEVKRNNKLRDYVANGTSVMVYNAPADWAAPIEVLNDGYLFPVSGIVTDSDWIEVTPWGNNGQRGYIKDATLVRLTNLDFKVKREGGVVSVPARASIHSHPDTSAPVLDSLDPGFTLNRTGVVTINGQTFDEVVVYTDGTKGYILRR